MQIKRAERAIRTIQLAISDVRTKVSIHQFENEEEEICFFKDLLPEFYSRLILELHVFQLESRRPKASVKLQRQVLQNELKYITFFLEKHAGFLQYYNAGDTSLDRQYFVRNPSGSASPLLLLDCSLALDNSFCTTYSLILSEIKAFEKLQRYVLIESYGLKHKNKHGGNNVIEPMEWKLGPFALTELGYLIYLTGAIPGSLKTVMAFLGKIFDIPLSNTSRILQQMRIRKGERAAFLAKGIRLVHQHMDSLDAKS